MSSGRDITWFPLHTVRVDAVSFLTDNNGGSAIGLSVILFLLTLLVLMIFYVVANPTVIVDDLPNSLVQVGTCVW
jgi:hypothetical protein